MAMARSLRALSLLPGLCSGSLAPSWSASCCRFASRGFNRTRTEPGGPGGDRFGSHGKRRSDGADELEDVEDKIQALVDAEGKRRKTVKYHIMRRKMTPAGPPQRKLTWDAMEQIRFLKQEQPEEWSVERLAESFSVPPEVIRRVLRTKFVPLPERREKQDAKVMAAAGLQALPSGAGTRQDRLAPPGNRTPAMLPSGGAGGALLAAASRTQAVPAGGSGSPPQSLVGVSASPAQRTAAVGKEASVTTSTEDSSMVDAEEEEDEEEDSWDGQVLTEQDLEELLGTEKPSPAVQVGKDFFDAEGNFLYRI